MNRLNDYKQCFFAILEMVIAYVYLHIFKRGLLKTNIWLIGEKRTEARDNGYHYYQYMKKNYPDTKTYYVIEKGSSDSSKISTDDLIPYGSFFHCVYYLAADFIVSGQSHFLSPFNKYTSLSNLFCYLMKKNCKRIWIRHGIGKDYIREFDPKVTKYDLIACGVLREYISYKEKYKIPSSKIALTGMCRFDNLQKHMLDKKDKTILVMPTFRSWLKTSDSSKDRANAEEERTFSDSNYYKSFISLLNDKKLIEALEQYHYNLVFYLHYTFQPYRFLFQNNLTNEAKKYTKIADRYSYDVQGLLMRSCALITDYSSVFFDFAYMAKPVIYYQFDYEEYRNKHYSEGWFSYKEDGFGPICKTAEETINALHEILSNDCHLEDYYNNRREGFFVPYDDRNCERTYMSITGEAND